MAVMSKVLFMVMKVKLFNGCGYHENKNYQCKHAANVMVFKYTIILST